MSDVLFQVLKHATHIGNSFLFIFKAVYKYCLRGVPTICRARDKFSNVFLAFSAFHAKDPQKFLCIYLFWKQVIRHHFPVFCMYLLFWSMVVTVIFFIFLLFYFPFSCFLSVCLFVLFFIFSFVLSPIFSNVLFFFIYLFLNFGFFFFDKFAIFFSFSVSLLLLLLLLLLLSLSLLFLCY